MVVTQYGRHLKGVLRNEIEVRNGKIAKGKLVFRAQPASEYTLKEWNSPKSAALPKPYGVLAWYSLTTPATYPLSSLDRCSCIEIL